MAKPVGREVVSRLSGMFSGSEQLGSLLVFAAPFIDFAELGSDVLDDLLSISSSSLTMDKYYGLEDQVTVKFNATVARAIGLVEKCDSGYWCVGDVVLDPRENPLLYASDPDTFATLASVLGSENGYVKLSTMSIPVDIFEKWYPQHPRPIDLVSCRASYSICPLRECYENAERAYRVAKNAYWRLVSLVVELSRRLPESLNHITGNCHVVVDSNDVKDVSVTVRASKNGTTSIDAFYSYPNTVVVIVSLKLPSYQLQEKLSGAPTIPDHALVVLDFDLDSIEKNEESVVNRIVGKIADELASYETAIADFVAKSHPALSRLRDFLARADALATAFVYHLVLRYRDIDDVAPHVPWLVEVLALMKGARDVYLRSVAEVTMKLSAMGRLSVSFNRVLVDGVEVGNLRALDDSTVVDLIKIVAKTSKKAHVAHRVSVKA